MNNPWIVVKFGDENHLKQLQDGKIYMNTWQYFQKLENNEQRDMNEGVHKWLNPEKTDIIINGRKLTTKNGTINASLSFPEKRIKIFCVSMICRNDEIRDDWKIFDDRIKDFGDSFLIINNFGDFFNRLNTSLKELINKKIIETYNFNKVEYFDQKTYDGEVGPFKKTSDYAHQKEWRLVIKTLSEDDIFEFNVSSIKDISYLGKTKDFVNRIEKNPNEEVYILRF